MKAISLQVRSSTLTEELQFELSFRVIDEFNLIKNNSETKRKAIQLLRKRVSDTLDAVTEGIY